MADDATQDAPLQLEKSADSPQAEKNEENQTGGDVEANPTKNPVVEQESEAPKAEEAADTNEKEPENDEFEKNDVDKSGNEPKVNTLVTEPVSSPEPTPEPNGSIEQEAVDSEEKKDEEDDVDSAQASESNEPEPTDTADAPNKEDDGVVDVSGILKDIDDFNKSTELEGNQGEDTGTSKSEENKAEQDETGSNVEQETETAPESTEESSEAPASDPQPAGEPKETEAVPDTSDAIAALKSLESYDDEASKKSNEPEQFSEDILDEEQGKDKNETEAINEENDDKRKEESKSEKEKEEVDSVPEDSSKETNQTTTDETDKETIEDSSKETNQATADETVQETTEDSSKETNQDETNKETTEESSDSVEKSSETSQKTNTATDTSNKPIGDKEAEQTDGTQEKPKEKAEVDKTDEAKKTQGVDKKPASKDTKETATKEVKDEKKDVKSDTAGSGSSKAKLKGPQSCIVCKKVGKCKYNIVRNGDIKHLCDDNCFKIFRANPTSFLRAGNQQQTTANKPIAPKKTATTNGAVDDDVEVLGMSKTTPAKSRSSAAKTSLCSVCKKVTVVKHEVNYGGKAHTLCSDSCFAAFRYSNKLTMNNCEHCGAITAADGPNSQSIQFEGQMKKFCTLNCLNGFKAKKNKIVGCTWCGTKKSNFDMVERVDGNKFQLFCSLNCLSLYRVNLQATSNLHVTCDQCHKAAPAQYHLTMSDASVRNFCTYTCVMAFQGQFTQAGSASSGPAKSQQTTPTGTGTRQSARQASKAAAAAAAADQGGIQISSVRSLAPQTKRSQEVHVNSTPSGPREKEVIVQPPPPKQVRNKALLCKPFTQTKATSCRPHTQTKETQTDDGDMEGGKVLIPIPVPIYIPVPTVMYSMPQPYPLPIPVPIPVPFFIPTTKKSADSILKHIKEIQERMPADPFEAELLMMAEAVAVAEKGSDDSSDESDVDTKPEDGFSQQNQQGSNMQGGVLGEDMLQMALRMAQEMPDEALDLEHSLNPSTINPDSVQPVQPVEFGTIAADPDVLTAMPSRGGRKRRGGGGGRGRGRSKKIKMEEQSEPVAANQPPPDANMVLKYTYGVNAWKHWVVNKNQQMQNNTTNNRSRLKLFKTDILQCTADELNFSLCLFVKEVRKPNGDEYAPDSIYYLCLGIQQYVFENGRIDNIFTDVYFERFTECLNEVLQKYEVRLNTAGLIVCRIEEEHLWESKQLGAHSPHVLLNTLIYFNTKYFMLKTPEDHLKLSFSHIMKHWKKTNIPGSKTPGRSVYLRYYAPVPNAKDAQKRKREELPVFEQGENVENPLRCPVKLYEFYLSKAPESIKNRNDVFYLIPERSCVPDSPVWYSTGNLGIDSMTKMLNRIRVVREIQEAHLHHQPVYPGQM